MAALVRVQKLSALQKVFSLGSDHNNMINQDSGPAWQAWGGSDLSPSTSFQIKLWPFHLCWLSTHRYWLGSINSHKEHPIVYGTKTSWTWNLGQASSHAPDTGCQAGYIPTITFCIPNPPLKNSKWLHRSHPFSQGLFRAQCSSHQVFCPWVTRLQRLCWGCTPDSTWITVYSLP